MQQQHHSVRNASNRTGQFFFFKKDELWDHSIAYVVNIIIRATQSVVISVSPLWNRAQAGRVILWSTSGADLQISANKCKSCWNILWWAQAK